ncbi:LYRM7 [Auxenochlorella protothecoides x Auxenochlorella symbiontica]
MSNPTSLQLYKRLLQSCHRAFKGDAVMLPEALKEIRSRFEESRGVRDPETLAKLQHDASEAAEFITTHVVQAATNERGNLEMTVPPITHGSEAEPVLPGMRLPREKKGRKAADANDGPRAE